MTLENLKEEISKLKLSLKLQLIEDVWDSIAESHSELPLPEWQKQELQNRYQEYKTENHELLEWNIVHAIFDNRQDPQKKP